MSIRIVYHVFAVHHWESIATTHMTKLLWSGLYDACEDVSVFAYGPDAPKVNDIVTRFGAKISVRVVDHGTGARETLLSMRDFVRATDRVLFLHAKGVTLVPPNRNVNDWLDFMDYYLISRWRTCLSVLETHDVAGCNFYSESKPHFSGNQWWCRGDYFLGLDECASIESTTWICGNPLAKLYELARSRTDHYTSAFPPRMYLDPPSLRDDLSKGRGGSSCIAVLTHQWTPEMRRRYDVLAETGTAVVLSCDTDALPLPPDVCAFVYGYAGIRVAYPGLQDIRHSMFAALAYMYEHHPEYEYYWFFENDVVFNGDIGDFFETFRGDTETDFLVPTFNSSSNAPDPARTGPGLSPDWYTAPSNRITDPSGTLAPIPTHGGLAVVQRYSRRFLEALASRLRAGLSGQCESLPYTLAHHLGMRVGTFGEYFSESCCDWDHRFTAPLPAWTRGKLVHAVKLP
jgi:hypothetical protein